MRSAVARTRKFHTFGRFQEIRAILYGIEGLPCSVIEVPDGGLTTSERKEATGQLPRKIDRGCVSWALRPRGTGCKPELKPPLDSISHHRDKAIEPGIGCPECHENGTTCQHIQSPPTNFAAKNGVKAGIACGPILAERIHRAPPPSRQRLFLCGPLWKSVPAPTPVGKAS